MKNNLISMSLHLFFLITVAAAVSVPAQSFGGERTKFSAAIEDKRPFDFADKLYESNGVFGPLMADRRNGADGSSVFDYTADPNRRQVRVTATMPAYGPDGGMVFWNMYGEFGKEAFTPNESGDNAYINALRHPVYMFPSETVKHSMRQAALIETDDAYLAKNPLGLGVIIDVEFTAEIHSKVGQRVVADMIARNGASLDGTPIIRTVEEMNTLRRLQLIRTTFRGEEQGLEAVYLAARILLDPTRGAIAPDAFLKFVQTPTGDPLVAEMQFLEMFECLQAEGRTCSK